MPTQLYAVSGSPRGPNLGSMRTELLTQIRTEMHAFHEQLMGQMQSNLAGMTTVLNQEVCSLRAEIQQEIGNIRAEIQQEIGNIRAELNEVRTFAEKNVRKRPAPLRLSPGLPTTVAEAHKGYHEPTTSSAGHGVGAADRV